MAIRTGAELLESLRDDRQMWIDGERVKDVTTDRRFAGPRTAWPSSTTCSTTRRSSSA